jgi:hypothetical protein
MWVSLLLGVVAAVVLGADDAATAYGSGSDDEFGRLGAVLFTVALLLGLVLVTFWGFLALRVKRGDNWARIVTVVLAVAIAAVSVGFGLTPTAWGFVVAEVAILGAICVLLALPTSSRYFARA